MSTKDDSSAAFPELGNVGYQSDWQSESGITKRDYFAAKAMQGYLAADIDTVACVSTDAEGIERERQQYAAGVAKAAYRFADAMLRERAK